MRKKLGQLSFLLLLHSAPLALAEYLPATYLQYQCQGQYWECVNQRQAKICYFESKLRAAQGIPFDCRVVSQFATEADCARAQMEQIHLPRYKDFCLATSKLKD